MNIYSRKVLDHFQAARNVGALEDAGGIVEFGDPGVVISSRSSSRLKEIR